MKKPPRVIPTAEARDYLEAAEAMVKELLGPDVTQHEACGFVIVPCADNTMFAMLFWRPDGSVLTVTLKRHLLEDMGGALGAVWQQMSDAAMLEGTPEGEA